MNNNVIQENPEFSRKLRKLEVTDRAHADVFNQEFNKLINNDVYLKNKTEELEKQKIDVNMISDILIPEDTSMVLGANVGKYIDQSITSLKNKSITLSANSSITLKVNDHCVVIVTTTFDLPQSRSMSVIFGGNNNQSNTGQKASVNTLIAGSYIEFEVSNVVGSFNNVKITNNCTYDCQLHIAKISGDYTTWSIMENNM